MKKTFVILILCGLMIPAMAAPAGRGGRQDRGKTQNIAKANRTPRPAPPRGHGRHHGGRGNEGVWLAAGITGIVANSLGIINAVANPVVVPQPVVAPVPQPVVYPQAVPQPVVYPQPVYYQQPVIVAPAPIPAYPIRRGWGW
jgi:hypothetical protein